MIGLPDKKIEDGLTAVHDEDLGWWVCEEHAKRAWRKCAVSIHMRCWNLARYVLGSNVETHLDLFTALVLRKAREWKYGYDEAFDEVTKSPGMYSLFFIELVPPTPLL